MVMLYKAKDIEKLKAQHQIEIELLKSKFSDFKLYHDNTVIRLEEENQKLKKCNNGLLNQINDLLKELSDLKEFFNWVGELSPKLILQFEHERRLKRLKEKK